MKRVLIASLFLVLTLVAGVALAQDPVKIGVITSITGRFAEFGEQHQAGIKAALEDVNAAGGVNGRTVEVVFEDDTSEVNAALAASEKLVNQGLPLVMGAYSSSITNPITQYFTRQKRPFLVFTSSDDAITRPGSDWVFRTNQPSYAYAQVLFDVFDQINAQRGAGTLKTVVTVHGNGAFESAVADAVDEIAAERGYTVVQRQDYDQTGADFRPILNRFKALNPDVLFMVSYAADSVALMRQVQEVGLDAKVFAGGAAGFALPGFIEGAGPAAEYVFTATMWTKDVPYPGAQELNARLTEILGRTPSYHAAQAYAGVIVAVDALKRAASFSPEDVRAALLATDMPNTVYGPIRFEDYQGYKNQAPLPAVAEQVVNGEFVTVYVNGAVVGDLLETPSWNAR
ncbi:MAG TPA: ABC transporter substrate-binding protein [Trueperaceae bacterium]|nr:ABC transporter substrate-binding protein [Trueperaceae bacterium]